MTQNVNEMFPVSDKQLKRAKNALWWRQTIQT